MHKYLFSFLLLIFLNPEIAKAQGIGQIRIQYANPGINNDLNVIAQVTIPSLPAFRISNSSRVSNDTLYLTACYYSGMFTAIARLTDTISIGSPPPGLTTLHFKIFTSGSSTQCDQIGSNFINQAFVISAPLGIKSTTLKPEILFYPNPAHDFLTIKNAAVQSIIIRDLTGKVVLKQLLPNESFSQLDLRALHKGCYLLETVRKDGKAYTGRLLKD